MVPGIPAMTQPVLRQMEKGENDIQRGLGGKKGSP